MARVWALNLNPRFCCFLPVTHSNDTLPLDLRFPIYRMGMTQVSTLQVLKGLNDIIHCAWYIDNIDDDGGDDDDEENV